MARIFAVTSDSDTLASLQTGFSSAVADGMSSAGDLVGIFEGDGALAAQLASTNGVVAVVDSDSLVSLVELFDGLTADPTQWGGALDAAFGAAAGMLSPESRLALVGSVLQLSPAFTAAEATSPASAIDPLSTSGACIPTPEAAPVPASSPLRAPRFAGDPVLEGCLAGTHRMKAPEAGVAVMKVQAALIDLGYRLPRKGADGHFGEETEKAVVAFKTAEGLWPNDAVVGKLTMGRLDGLFAP